MPDFDKLVSRHGEVTAQAILEDLERFNGIPSNRDIPLEHRWSALMSAPAANDNSRAA